MIEYDIYGFDGSDMVDQTYSQEHKYDELTNKVDPKTITFWTGSMLSGLFVTHLAGWV